MSVFSIVGWIGAITFIMAYFLLSTKRLSADKITYHALNALGGLCLVINSWSLNDTPTLFVNFVWMGIALYSVLRILIISTKKISQHPG